MEVAPDGNSDKRRILSELSKCLKTVYIEASTHDSSQLNLNSALIHCIDRSFQHGLLNLVQSYWPLVRSISHAQTLQTIDGWVGSQSSNRTKSQAWLLATLVEGSLLSYLQCILVEPRLISRLYAEHAILCDPSCVTQLSSLLLGLESISFTIEPGVESKNNSIADLNLCLGLEETSTLMKPVLDLPLTGNNGATGVCMTSSMTSSLASPGDSGFTQLDSETDTASFSEVMLDADSGSVKEEVAVLPVDPCVEKTVGISSPFVPMTVSDIANANTSSEFPNEKSNSGNATDTFTDCVSLDNPDDNIVYKYPKNIARKSSNQKRVSFHECFPDSSLSCNDVRENCFAEKSGAFHSSFMDKDSVSSFSRTVGDLSSFENEQEGVEIAKDSSILGNDGIDELSREKLGHSLVSAEGASIVGSSVNAVKSVIFGQISRHIGQKTPVTERGNPEGQEDPPLKCSYTTPTKQLSLMAYESLRTSVNSSPAPSISSLRPQVSTPRRTSMNSGSNTNGLSNLSASSVLSQPPSKACLVNRFLRSITEKKISSCRSSAALAALNKNKSSRKLNLYIPGVKPANELSQDLLYELKEEVNNFTCVPSTSMSTLHLVDISPALDKTLHSHLGLPASEKISKVLKVWGTSSTESGKRAPFLAILTDQALYVADKKIIKHHVMIHSNLTTVVVGPNSQWISLISSEKSFQINLVVGQSESVSDLVSCIELSLRRKGSKMLPDVIHLIYEEYFRVPQWIPILKGETVAHFSLVHAMEGTPNNPNPHLLVDLRAYFMYKVNREHPESSWEPGYFVLKDRILYVSLDEDSLPHCTLNLHRVKCCFISLPSRPHTIEVGHMHIAAPDDCVAQLWLTALEKSSEVFESNISSHQSNIIQSSLILTETRLMLLSSLGIPRYDLDNLAKPFLTAFVSDITSLRIGDKESSWCFVEFSCREVYESDGDYLIFFSTYYEREAFKECLWRLSPVLKQNTCTLSSFEAVHCNGIANDFISEWNFLDCITH